MEQTTYKIGEAAALLNLKTYVLRFWETEFPQISPLRTEKGQRLYTRKDIELLKRIRFLLHERGLTIEGARRILSEESARGGHAPTSLFSMPLTLHDVLEDGKSSPETLDAGSPEEDTALPYERPRVAVAGGENGTGEDPPVPHYSGRLPGIGASAEDRRDPVSGKGPPDLSEQTLRRNIINELEDVAAMLRGHPKTGNYLQ